MTDWDKQLRKDRAAFDAARQRMEQNITAANLDGHPYRWIASRVRLNHETVRQITVKLKPETDAVAPPATEES